MKKQLEVQRHELKFYLNRSDYEYSSVLLSELMQKDENQKEERGYFIRSLYLDDVAESAVEDKLSGIEDRDKYRLRIYDTKQDWVKLERKRKKNNFVQKLSLIITRGQAEEIISGNYECLLEMKTKESLIFYFDFKSKYLRPVVIVDYIRDVYKLDYNNIRITFDKKLRANTSDLDLFSDTISTIPLQRSDLIEMEVKFNNFLPSWFKSFFYFESAVQLAISKYCQGRMSTMEYSDS